MLDITRFFVVSNMTHVLLFTCLKWLVWSDYSVILSNCLLWLKSVIKNNLKDKFCYSMVNIQTCTSWWMTSKHFCRQYWKEKNLIFFFMACKFVMENTICDSIIQEKNLKKKVVWRCGMLFHVILILDLIYPCHNF